MAKDMRTNSSIDPKTVIAGSNAFRAREKRDAIYKVSTFLVENFWGNPPQMADSLGVLLLIWNNALYRYGLFDYFALENTLRENMSTLTCFRNRNILTFKEGDKRTIESLFVDFLNALKISEGKLKGRQSPVSVAKALHLLAPNFFPLWDDKIAKAYRCHYSADPGGKYVAFMAISKNMVECLRGRVPVPPPSTILKVIDEYNYAKFTKKWI